MTQLTGQPETTLVLDAAAGRSGGLALLADLREMCKLRITVMVVVTAYIGFHMAPSAADPSWVTLVATLVGTALSCMGAATLNQAMERDTDRLMERTMNRPLPAGRIGLGLAVAVGLLLSGLGVALLAALSTPLAAVVALVTVASYVLVYTPMKRVSSACTIVGAVPGALPPVIGYAGATGRLDAAAWAMFAILFLWQLPHFLAIAWLYREDYARAGMPMLPVVDTNGQATFRQILLGCMALLPVGLLPAMLGMSGLIYFAGALLAGLMFLGFGVALVMNPTRRHARAMFFASLVYLPAVFALMLIDRM